MTTTRTTLLLTLALALLTACEQPVEVDPGGDEMGIAIGNPGVVSLGIAASDDLSLTLAELPLAALDHHGCSAEPATGITDVTLDLTDGPASVELLAGTWCGLRLELADPLVVEAEWAPATGEAATVELALEVAMVDLEPLDDGSFTVDEETELALELAAPGWLDAELLALEDGDVLVVEPGHALHLDLFGAVTEDSAAFEDLDGSGLVEQPERDAGPLLVGGDLVFEAAPAGLSDSQYASGCSTSVAPRPDPGLLLLALALGVAALLPRHRDSGNG